MREFYDGFTASLYKKIHKMIKYGWRFEELMSIPPLELSIFRNMIISELKQKG